MLPDSVATYLAEPPVPSPPRRVWRDWVLVAVVSVTAVLEFIFRTDRDFGDMPLGWRIASLLTFFAVVPASLLYRRITPLLAMVVAFTSIMGFGVLARLAVGVPGGLGASGVVLVTAYSVYRWGSGRDGARGAAVLVGAVVVGNLTDAGNVSEVIGGTIVVILPVLFGLMVRYRRVAQQRATTEAQASERAALARELHDTVAHHVSAIAVQAQAGRAIAATDPQRAIGVLAVIEEAASRTLDDMRAIVNTLRAGSTADLTPNVGLTDLARLASRDAALPVRVTIDPGVGEVSAPVGAACYRIAQESITNARRHARGATRVDVTLAGNEQVLRLTITNDGAPAALLTSTGYGLVGMTERAHLLGGSLHAAPRPDGGWVVTADLPRHLGEGRPQ